MVKLTKRKGFNFFRSYYDVYNELDDKDKVAFMDALLDRQFLGTKPTELNGMSKFAYISQTNSIDSQVKGYEDKTNTKLVDNNLPPTEGGRQGGNHPPTLQEEVQVQGEEKVQEEVKDKKKEVFNFRKSLINYGFEENLIKDWLDVRKLKRSRNTKTAFDGFIREIEKTNKDKNDILRICVEKSWSGLNAEWIKNLENGQNQQNSTTIKSKDRIATDFTDKC